MVDLRRCTHGVGSMSEEDALKNWLCRWSIVPYTSSVAVQWMPSLMPVQVQGNTMGSESVQLVGSGCTFREALTWRWRLSTQSIGDRVIDGHVLGTQELNEVSEEFRLKLASSVCRDGWKGAKASNPTRVSWSIWKGSNWICTFLQGLCVAHMLLYRPFRITNGCLWLISCLKVFEIVIYYGEVKPGLLCRTQTVVLRGALHQFTYLQNRIQHS